uniref:K Homology domain-containing protein n=1 Tax=Leersia perrieri TaxID=77586 RepID=A0A0D9WYB0_9ORYZ
MAGAGARARPFFSPHEAFALAPPSPLSTPPSSLLAPLPSPASASAVSDDSEVAVFRLLLPDAFSDADAMRLYAAIAPLRHRVPTLQVRVETLARASSSSSSDGDGEDGGGDGDDDLSRVAVVLGPASPSRRVEASSSSGATLELSPAQEALVAVLDSGGVLHLHDGGGDARVTCLVLVEADRFAAAFGEEILPAIARESGAEVRAETWGDDDDDGDDDAQPAEEIIEITGDGTTVRRALVAVSSCLQGERPLDSLTTSAHSASPMFTQTFPKVPEAELGSLQSDVSTECAKSSIPYIDCPQGVTGIEQTDCLQQFSFRLLCSVNVAGGLIGKNGMVVKAIEVKTGASVDVCTTLNECKERVVTISALENPGQKFSVVQNALLDVFDRMQKVESNLHLRPGNTLQRSARVLITKSQFGCLIGPGGETVKAMRNTTRTRIQILNETDVPACASQYELINGELTNVRNALLLVSEKLRNHIFSSKRTTYNDDNDISSIGQYTADKLSRVDHGLSQNEIESVQNSISAFHLECSGSPQIQKPSNGSGTEINKPIGAVQKPANGNGTGINNLNIVPQNDNGTNMSNHGITSLEENNLLRGIKTANIARITYEIAIWGDSGNVLAELRETLLLKIHFQGHLVQFTMAKLHDLIKPQVSSPDLHA